MQFHTIHDIVLPGAAGRPLLADRTAPIADPRPTTVVFVHGFKGFKDWGCWPLMARTIAGRGYPVVRVNLSHNGTTVRDPAAFGDLEAFGQNTYSKELFDVRTVIDHVNTDAVFGPARDVVLMGHSRGGGIAILAAENDDRVRYLALLASVADLDRFGSASEIDAWRRAGVRTIPNARTKQEMPQLFDLYRDFAENRTAFDIGRALAAIDIPVTAWHGTADPAVDVEAARKIASWARNGEAVVLDGVDHVFGTRHPWHGDDLPEPLARVVGDLLSRLD